MKTNKSIWPKPKAQSIRRQRRIRGKNRKWLPLGHELARCILQNRRHIPLPQSFSDFLAGKTRLMQTDDDIKFWPDIPTRKITP